MGRRKMFICAERRKTEIISSIFRKNIFDTVSIKTLGRC